MIDRIVNIIDWFYRGWRRDLIKKLGVDNILAPIYLKLSEMAHPDTVKIEIGGRRVEFHATQRSEFLRFHDGLEERQMIEELISMISPEDCFFDVGANIGAYTVPAATESDNVYAFDPIQNNLSRLNQNLSLNDVQAHLLPVALSDKTGVDSLELAQNYDSSVGHAGHILSSVTRNPQAEPRRRLPILSLTGDHVVEAGIAPTPNVIKIDVDGAEHHVVRGLSDTLKQDECWLIYIEVHRGILTDIGVEWREIEEMIKEFGFRTKRVNLQGRDDESGTYILRGIRQ